jgi:hypothetical protein
MLFDGGHLLFAFLFNCDHSHCDNDHDNAFAQNLILITMD